MIGIKHLIRHYFNADHYYFLMIKFFVERLLIFLAKFAKQI